MGCDIHMILERRWRDKWVGMCEVNSEANNRNYDLFGRLAGVRGGGWYSPSPRGVPPDASDLALMQIESWGHDIHSHSWAILAEFLTAYIHSNQLEPDAQEADAQFRQRLAWRLFELEPRICHSDKFRLVYWFDS